MAEAQTDRARILFVAEAVTLAHVARPVALARGLDPARYEVLLAADPRYDPLLADFPGESRPIRSIPGAQFLDALARGRPLYDAATLRAYVRDDLDLIAATRPAAVVGDFRLSLSISARLAGVPYLAITNAYWSPYARLGFPMPDLPIGRVLPGPIARTLFGLGRPFAFALHSRPLNRVRREFGLPSLGLDLRRVYTDADHTLYADVPELVPTSPLPPNHHYLGPILWSPAVELPAWWMESGPDCPVIYATLGSSGRMELNAAVLQALADLPASVWLATAGRGNPEVVPSNARVADYLPGEAASARAQLVICNGGSPTTQQALAVGTPMLGLVSNLDQHLNMRAIVRAGAGIVLRAEEANPATIRAAASRTLAEPSYRESAVRLAGIFGQYRAAERFEVILAEVLGRSRGSLA